MLVFAASDPVFGGGACHVESCLRSARSWGLCSAHYQRWKKDGRPPLEVFAATTDPRWQRQRPNARCRPLTVVTASSGAPCARRISSAGTAPAARAWRPGSPTRRWLSSPCPGRAAFSRTASCGRTVQTPFCRPHEAAWPPMGVPTSTTSPAASCRGPPLRTRP